MRKILTIVALPMLLLAGPTLAGPATNPLESNPGGDYHGDNRPGLTGTASAGQNENAFGGGGAIHNIQPGRQDGATPGNRGEPARDKHGGLDDANPAHSTKLP